MSTLQKHGRDYVHLYKNGKGGFCPGGILSYTRYFYATFYHFRASASILLLTDVSVVIMVSVLADHYPELTCHLNCGSCHLDAVLNVLTKCGNIWWHHTRFYAFDKLQFQKLSKFGCQM